MDPFISVIVPNYNHSQFLSKRIDSILNQSYTSYELILLDDCSSDNSCAIIDIYNNHPKVSKVIYNKTNSGCLFSQWKKGLDAAKGEWIWIAESDDFSSPLFLESLVEQITEETVLIYSKSIIVDEKGKEYSNSLQWLKDLSESKWDANFLDKGELLFSHYWAYKNIVSNTSSVIFKKQVVHKLIFPNDFKYCGDWLFFAQFCFYGKIAYVAKPLNYWRQHKNTTRNIFSLEKEVIRLNENTKIIRIFKDLSNKNKVHLQYKKYYWIVERWLCFFTYKNLMQKSYMNPSFPFKLKIVFYFHLVKRVMVEIFKSVKKKIVL